MNLNSVLIIGAGTMGSGIAQWFCLQGMKVHLTDNSIDILKSSKENITKSFEKLVTRKKITQDEVDLFKSNLSYIDYLKIGNDYNLIIEAIIENKDIKKTLFENLDKHCEEHTVFATNTSSIPIASLASGLSDKRSEKFLGLHFFNPATIMKLVEIIGHTKTDPSVISELYTWFEDKKKCPVICRDSPGFIVNRVARNFYGEALRIAGMSSKEENFKEIDTIMREVGGFKMGPFELLDLIGIDVNLSVTESVWNSFYQEPRFAPHRLQKELVNSGKHGKKTGQGFYEYK
jgi:3-hydroxybutyryl-CoA dehydrogenase